MRQFASSLRLEEQCLEPFNEVCVYPSGRILNHRVDAGPEKQAPGDAAVAQIQLYRGVGDLRENVSRGSSPPALHVQERLSSFADLVEEALVEEMQERVFVWKTPIEGADGYAGAQHDFGNGGFGKALFVEHALGRIKNSVKGFLTAYLSRRTDSRNRHRFELSSAGGFGFSPGDLIGECKF